MIEINNKDPGENYPEHISLITDNTGWSENVQMEKWITKSLTHTLLFISTSMI